MLTVETHKAVKYPLHNQKCTGKSCSRQFFAWKLLGFELCDIETSTTVEGTNDKPSLD